ncbi:MmgE/PrpD family protein [Streptomyces althioticus]|uniref:MmgE/PrpD family protein n=1 Tax=Streptomyces althioticus TaxID=83380 RepID=UPI0036930376
MSSPDRTTIPAPEPTGAPATDPGGPTGMLATWLAGTTLEDIPAAVRERAKHLLLDGVACALVGARLPVSRVGVQGVTALDDAGDAVIIGWGGRTTSAPSAAMINSSFIQGFELDDYHPVAPLHSNSLILPALLAAVPRIGKVPGTRFLLGALLGYETGPRVGLALHGGEMLSRGWHSGPVFGTHAAAAAAGTLYRLDAAGFEDALGIAGTQSGGLMAAQFESMVKRMQHGFAARNGLTAAALAASGYVGIKRVFEREYGGFLSTFGEGRSPDPDQIAGTLGSTWETERIAVKAYAAMGGLHAAIDAALELRHGLPAPAEDIEHIRVDVSEAAYHHGGWQADRPLEPIGAQMNLAYAAATALIDGAALLDQFTAERINRDDVWRLIERTEVRHDPAFDRLARDERLTTRLTLTLKDGSVRTIEVAHPRGTGDRHLSNTDIATKYRDLTHALVTPERQAAIEQAVLGIDHLEDITELTDLLTPEVRPALG